MVKSLCVFVQASKSLLAVAERTRLEEILRRIGKIIYCHKLQVFGELHIELK
ncbi:hypothetical protein D3C81_1974120 [compost metagenome]